jgi:hypothetical protein
MAKQALGEKTVRELRTIAKRAGIAVKGDWIKKDLVKVLSSEKESAAKPVKPTKKTKPVKPAKKTLSRKTEDKKSVVHKAAGKQAAKKSLEKAHTVKQKSVSLKASPKKSPLTDFESVTVKPPAELGLTPLPAEYFEDKIVSMQVTPGRIYIYWEVAEDSLMKYKGSLNLRVLAMKGNNFFYAPVSGRIGESFININPDSDYAVEIGVIDSKGEFVNIIQTESTAIAEVFSQMPEGSAGGIRTCQQPEMTGPEQKGKVALPEEFFEVPEPVSSR